MKHTDIRLRWYFDVNFAKLRGNCFIQRVPGDVSSIFRMLVALRTIFSGPNTDWILQKHCPSSSSLLTRCMDFLGFPGSGTEWTVRCLRRMIFCSPALGLSRAPNSPDSVSHQVWYCWSAHIGIRHTSRWKSIGLWGLFWHSSWVFFQGQIGNHSCSNDSWGLHISHIFFPLNPSNDDILQAWANYGVAIVLKLRLAIDCHGIAVQLDRRVFAGKAPTWSAGLLEGPWRGRTAQWSHNLQCWIKFLWHLAVLKLL